MRGFESCYPCIHLILNLNHTNFIKNNLLCNEINFYFSNNNKSKIFDSIKKNKNNIKKKGNIYIYAVGGTKKKNIRTSPIVLQAPIKISFKASIVSKSKNYKSFLKQKNHTPSLKQKNAFFFFNARSDNSNKNYLDRYLRGKYLSKGINVSHFVFTKNNNSLISDFLNFFLVDYLSIPQNKNIFILRNCYNFIFFSKNYTSFKILSFFFKSETLLFSFKSITSSITHPNVFLMQKTSKLLQLQKPTHPLFEYKPQFFFNLNLDETYKLKSKIFSFFTTGKKGKKTQTLKNKLPLLQFSYYFIRHTPLSAKILKLKKKTLSGCIFPEDPASLYYLQTRFSSEDKVEGFANVFIEKNNQTNNLILPTTFKYKKERNPAPLANFLFFIPNKDSIFLKIHTVSSSNYSPRGVENTFLASKENHKFKVNLFLRRILLSFFFNYNNFGYRKIKTKKKTKKNLSKINKINLNFLQFTIKNKNTGKYLKKNKSVVKKNNFNFFNFKNIYSFSRNYSFFSTKEVIFFIVSKPIFFKSFIYNFKKNMIPSFFVNSLFSFYFTNFYKNLPFNKNNSLKLFSNVVPDLSSFFFKFKRIFTQDYTSQNFNGLNNLHYYDSLISFLEHCSGKKVIIKNNSFLITYLDFDERANCALWTPRIKVFRKMLGHRLFLNESLVILYVCIKLRDPFLLSSWMLGMFYKISFWKYKLLFRYLYYVLKYFMWPTFASKCIKGLRFQLKGKVSVAGNARTRIVSTSIGATGNGNLNKRVLTNLNLLRTFTGVIGFRTWLSF